MKSKLLLKVASFIIFLGVVLGLISISFNKSSFKYSFNLCFDISGISIDNFDSLSFFKDKSGYCISPPKFHNFLSNAKLSKLSCYSSFFSFILSSKFIWDVSPILKNASCFSSWFDIFPRIY